MRYGKHYHELIKKTSEYMDIYKNIFIYYSIRYAFAPKAKAWQEFSQVPR